MPKECLRRLIKPLVLICFIASWGSAFSQQSLLPPEPLTLEAALSFADNSDQYQLQNAHEKLQQALANAAQNESVNDVTVNLSGRLRKVGVSELGDEEEDDDSKVSLFVRKPLYDFGKSDGYEDLGSLTVELRRLEKDHVIEQRQLAIAEKYFDVLNADNEYLRNNEEMAIGFIQFDRARENKELGLASEIEVMQKQVAYEVIRQNRYHSENSQRLTRTILAEAMGFPDNPPSEVAVPELSTRVKITDDVDLLVNQAFKNSLKVKIQQQKLNIAKQGIKVARHTSGAKLDAELEVSDYAREGSTRDDWRASIYFDFPLYAGSKEQSAIKSANAKYRQVLSEMQQLQSEVRLEVLQLWQSIQQNSLRLTGELINQDYRDMYLDKSRAEYELEFKTDLGDSMVQFSESRKNTYRVRFALEMAWLRLEKLVGKEFLQSLHTDGENNG